MATSSQRRRLLRALAGVLTILLVAPAAFATEPDVSLEPAGLKGGGVPTAMGGSVDGALATPAADLAGYSRFTTTPTVLEESTPWRDLVVDLDGDGYDELIYGYSWAVTIMRGSSTGIQEIERHELDESGDHPVAVGDYNSDGLLDLAVGYSLDPLFAIFYGKADGGFEDRVDFPVARSISVASVDINRDGRDDLAVRDNDQPRLQFYVQQDDGSLQRSDAYPNAPEISGYLWFEPGDFNGDGLVDFLAWTRDFDAGYAAYIMQASPGSWLAPEIIPTFGPADGTPTDWYPTFVFVDDMDLLYQ